MAKNAKKAAKIETKDDVAVIDLPAVKKARAKSKKKAEAVVETAAETEIPVAETVAETEEDRIAREEAEAKAEAEETAKAAAAAEEAVIELEAAEAATAGTLVPAYLNLGRRLIVLQSRFKSLRLFGEFLKADHPRIAEVPSDVRSNCKWLAENIYEILNAFGYNSADQLPWANPATIKRKFIAWQDAQKPAEDLAEEGEEGAAEEGEEASEDRGEADAKAEAVADFISRFSKLSKAEMIETMTEIVKIGVDRKLKVSDLAD